VWSSVAFDCRVAAEAASPWPSPLHSFKQCRDFRVAVLVTVVLLGLAAEPLPPILLHTTGILTTPASFNVP